jgi:hypothetical protein
LKPSGGNGSDALVVDALLFGAVVAADVTRTAVNDHRGLPLVTGLAGPAAPIVDRSPNLAR